MLIQHDTSLKNIKTALFSDRSSVQEMKGIKQDVVIVRKTTRWCHEFNLPISIPGHFIPFTPKLFIHNTIIPFFMKIAYLMILL